MASGPQLLTPHTLQSMTHRTVGREKMAQRPRGIVYHPQTQVSSSIPKYTQGTLNLSIRYAVKYKGLPQSK